MTLLSQLQDFVLYQLILVSNLASSAVKTDNIPVKCNFANQLKPVLYNIVGEFKGLGGLFAYVATAVILVVLIVAAWKTDKLKWLVGTLAVIVIAAALLFGGVNFVPNSTC